MAAIESMNGKALTIKQESNFRITIRWISILIFIFVCALALKNLHEQQLQKLTTDSNLLKQKSMLISKMHNQMLSITQTQLQIFHSSSQKQVNDNLRQLSELVTEHLVNYHQLKNIADESDEGLLNHFRSGFEKWHNYNENLLNYANVVSDTGFLNTLSMIRVAFNHIDNDTDDAIQIIAQLKTINEYNKEMSY